MRAACAGGTLLPLVHGALVSSLVVFLLWAIDAWITVYKYPADVTPAQVAEADVVSRDKGGDQASNTTRRKHGFRLLADRIAYILRRTRSTRSNIQQMQLTTAQAQGDPQTPTSPGSPHPAPLRRSVSRVRQFGGAAMARFRKLKHLGNLKKFASDRGSAALAPIRAARRGASFSVPSAVVGVLLLCIWTLAFGARVDGCASVESLVVVLVVGHLLGAVVGLVSVLLSGDGTATVLVDKVATGFASAYVNCEPLRHQRCDTVHVLVLTVGTVHCVGVAALRQRRG